MEKEKFCEKYGLTEAQFEGDKEYIGFLNLVNVTSIPEGFNPNEFQNQNVSFLEWKMDTGHFIKCDGRFSEVVSQKGNVWKLKDVNRENLYWLITDGRGKYSHGKTLKEAKEDLIFKISNRNKSRYHGLDVTKKLPFAECVQMYRIITGSCASGVKDYIKKNRLEQKSYSVEEIIDLTKGAYGSTDFSDFFSKKASK